MLKKFEGFSSHLNILGNIKDKVEKSWDRIIKNGYKGTVTYNFKPNKYDILNKPTEEDIYDKNGNLKMVTIKVEFGINNNIKDKGTYVKRTKWNRWFIKVNMGYELDSGNFQLKSKNKVFSNLVHEIVHISQYYNGFSNYVENKFSEEYKRGKRNITYNKFYNDKHSEYGTEKEAVMVEFFEYLKRDKINAFNYLMNVPEYFNYYTYRKFINKAVKYGIKIEDINFIKEKLSEYLNSKIQEMKDKKFFMNNIFQELEQKILLFEQFNISYKEKLKEILELLDNTEPKRIPNYKNIKNKIENLIK